MTRSRNIGICVMVALGAASLTSAQTNIDDEIELSRSVIQTQRQAIVTEAMQLTEAESKVFWPLFREFQGEMAKVGDRKVALITSYAENFETFTDDQARLMMDEWLDIEKARLKVLGKHVKSFRKILPEKKVTRYFQLENKLDAVINAELAAQIPLVE